MLCCLCIFSWSKAFDLVSHEILFSRLLDRNFPVQLIHLLMSSTSLCKNQSMCIRWDGSFSDSFQASSGVRHFHALLFRTLMLPSIRFYVESGVLLPADYIPTLNHFPRLFPLLLIILWLRQHVGDRHLKQYFVEDHNYLCCSD